MSCSLLGNRRDVEAREAIAEHYAEVVEVLESALALDVSVRVPPHHGVGVVVASDSALGKGRLTHVKLDLPLIAWDVGRLIDLSFSGSSVGVIRSVLLLLRLLGLLPWLIVLALRICLGLLIVLLIWIVILLAAVLRILLLIRVIVLLLGLVVVG